MNRAKIEHWGRLCGFAGAALSILGATIALIYSFQDNKVEKTAFRTQPKIRAEPLHLSLFAD